MTLEFNCQHFPSVLILVSSNCVETTTSNKSGEILKNKVCRRDTIFAQYCVLYVNV